MIDLTSENTETENTHTDRHDGKQKRHTKRRAKVSSEGSYYEPDTYDLEL